MDLQTNIVEVTVENGYWERYKMIPNKRTNNLIE